MRRAVRRDEGFGLRLVEAMDRAGVRPSALAKAQNVSPGTVSRWRAGECPDDLRFPSLAALVPPPSQWDGLQLYLGARALLAGQDPYAVVPRQFPYPLYYPLPAVLLAVPFAWLSPVGARIAWAAVTGGIFAYAFRGRPQLLACLSAPFLVCVILGHLAPALMAAAVVPGLGFLWAAKPSVGLALFAAYPSRKAVIGCVILCVISLVVMPGWPREWLAALGSLPHKAPIFQPGGVLLLLAVRKWRTPEGRLCSVFATVPHGGYDALILFLIPRTRRQVLGLAVSTMLGAVVSHALWPWSWSTPETHPGRWLVVFATLYLPALALVLRGNRLEGARRRGETRGTASRSPGTDRDPLSG